MKKYKQFINGKLVASQTSEVIEVLNPCTEEVISTISKGAVADANAALDAAEKAQPAWEALTATERSVYLKKMAEVIRANRVSLAHTLASEQAKVIGLAQVEIDFTAEYFDYNAAWARRIEGEIIQSDRKNENIYLYKSPIGVAVGICPWNFPFFVMARKIAPALITGCTSVIKPSSIAPNTIMEFAELMSQTDLPAGVLNIVCGNGSLIGDTLSKSPKTGIISLTGSVDAGQKVMEAASNNLTKVSLELGGKAPVIVCADANLQKTIDAVVTSRITFSGQICNCAERVYVEESLYDEFVEKVTRAMEAVAVGDAFNENVAMSSQVSADQVAKIEQMVNFAKKEGAEVLTGGTRHSSFDKGYYFQPTVLANCTQNMQVVREEIFGPVLPVLKFSTLDEAIDLANDCEYGLTSSVFSENYNQVMQVINRLKFGETYVNREHFETIQGFHAGWRKSGIGGADGKHGMEEYLQTRVIYSQYE